MIIDEHKADKGSGAAALPGEINSCCSPEVFHSSSFTLLSAEQRLVLRQRRSQRPLFSHRCWLKPFRNQQHPQKLPIVCSLQLPVRAVKTCTWETAQKTAAAGGNWGRECGRGRCSLGFLPLLLFLLKVRGYQWVSQQTALGQRG